MCTAHACIVLWTICAFMADIRASPHRYIGAAQAHDFEPIGAHLRLGGFASIGSESCACASYVDTGLAPIEK